MKMRIGFGGLLLAFTLVGCGKQDGAASAPQSSDNPVDAPANYLRAMEKAQKSAIKTIDTAALNQAIQMFQVSEGRNPKTLDELVPKYIRQLPPPPAGMKFDYDSAAGAVKVVPK